MKKSTSLFLFIMLSLTTLLMSCDEKKATVPPTFKGFRHTPSVVHPGDTVRLTAYYANKGEYWHKPMCYWTFEMDTVNVEKNQRHLASYSQSVQQSVADESLTTTFIVPKNAYLPGKVTARLKVSMFNSVTAENVGFRLTNSTEAGYEGCFNNSIISSQLYCDASGWMDFLVTEKN